MSDAMYPSATPAAKPAEPAPAAIMPEMPARATPAPAASPAAPPVAAEVAKQPDARASLYDDNPTTREPVRWNEEPARDGRAISFDVPGDADLTDTGDAERATLAAAMAHAGAGQSLGRELYRDVMAASRENYSRVAPDAGVAALRETWGGSFDRNIAAARALVAKAAERDPSIIGYLERTGLGNDPAFIRKIAARAAKLAK